MVQLLKIARVPGALCASVAGLSSYVLAQAPAAPAPTVVVPGRSLALEWGITIVMIGLAIFVVCRSSNRN